MYGTDVCNALHQGVGFEKYDWIYEMDGARIHIEKRWIRCVRTPPRILPRISSLFEDRECRFKGNEFKKRRWCKLSCLMS